VKAVLLNRGPGAEARIGGRTVGWHVLHWLAGQGVHDFVVCGTPVDGAQPGWHMTTLAGGRLKQAEPYIDEDLFLAVTVSGLADVDLTALVACSRAHGRLATVTAVRPAAADYESAGIFVLRRAVFDYLDGDSELEQEPLVALARDGELFAFRHDGFFHPVRTDEDGARLDQLWASGQAPWLAA
jgi:glucose-1-phosphate cytidylyltransferase